MACLGTPFSMSATSTPIPIVGPAAPSSLRLSQLAPGLAQSEIRAMTVACADVGGINLAQGVCDTDPPHPVVEAAIQAIREGHNIYVRLDGIAVLREAIAQKLASFNRIDADPNANVLVTSGATGALHAALMALLDPGDECIIFEPFYGYHTATLNSQRVKPVVVPLNEPDWALDLDRLKAAITPRTRAMILNTPANPSGKVFSREELEAIAEIAIEHDLFVFTDEIYEYFLYDGERHLSLATLPGMEARTITISGFSKTFSVTGWRLGYLSASERWIPAIGYFHDLTYVCAPSPFQHAAAAGLLQLPQSFYNELSVEYQAKRDSFCASLARAGLTPSIPTGAYYVLADVSRIEGATSKAKARKLLADTSLAAVAGSAFFSVDSDGRNRGDHLLRFCFAKKDSDLAEACRRLDAYRG
jgi:aminotransferase